MTAGRQEAESRVGRAGAEGQSLPIGSGAVGGFEGVRGWEEGGGLAWGVINALPQQVCVLDAAGRILAVNRSWEVFALANGGQLDRLGPGTGYLEVVKQAGGDCAPEAQVCLEGLNRVLQGEIPVFELEYRCHTPDRLQWFRMQALGLDVGGRARALVLHTDVTTRRRAEDALRTEVRRSSALLRMANELGADSTLAGVAMEICRSALAVLGSEATSLVIGQASWAGSAWVCGGDGVAMRYPEVVGLEGWGGGEWEVRVLGLDDGRLGGLRSWLESKGMTLSHYAPILRGSDCMGYLGLHHRDGASRVWELDPALFRGATELAALALVRAMSLEELKKQGEQLRLLAAKAVEVEDAERRRISSDLHDLAGQHLAALGFQLQLMESRLPAECREVEGPALRDMHASVQLLGGVLRGVMADLRPLISEEGLLGSFRACAMPVSRRTGLRVEVEGEDPVKRLGPAAEGALVRIVQEALENAARHGGAKRATVVLQRQGESGWVLEVADDGCGFDPAELGQRSERPRLGMVAMRERALALNASFEVLTAPGQGVRVRVRRKAPA